MCNQWVMKCGHMVVKECNWPHYPYSNDQALNQAYPITFFCKGMPEEPTLAKSRCYDCLFSVTTKDMMAARDEIDEMKARRAGAGNDNWGYSSRGMVGFGEAGNSSWIDQDAKDTSTDMDYIRTDRVGIWPWNDADTMRRVRQGYTTNAEHGNTDVVASTGGIKDTGTMIIKFGDLSPLKIGSKVTDTYYTSPSKASTGSRTIYTNYYNDSEANFDPFGNTDSVDPFATYNYGITNTVVGEHPVGSSYDNSGRRVSHKRTETFHAPDSFKAHIVFSPDVPPAFPVRERARANSVF